MVSDLLALSWWTIFAWTLKAFSAWLLACLIVVMPLALLKHLSEKD